VIKFVSDLRHVSGFLRLPQFTPPIKLPRPFTYIEYFVSNSWFRLMAFNVTFNNISVISWRSVLLVEETGVAGENH
jgi:hypothetical protein